jgi:hypothetical protein
MSNLPAAPGAFVRLVESYRAAEKEYFKDRTRSNQEEVTRLRRLVDSMIVSYNSKVAMFAQLGGQFTLTEPPAAYVVGDEAET